jgi:putative tryptophan/tyrosine transport system substrate-binding protein
MKRREFITLGAAAAAWPLAVLAQQPAARVARIGWIAIGTPQGSEFFEAVRQGLRQLGYVEGRSVIIEPRWPADIRDRVPELLRELLALNVQVIGPGSDRASRAAINRFDSRGVRLLGATPSLSAKRQARAQETATADPPLSAPR